jgi:RHS repeat-associated protein
VTGTGFTGATNVSFGSAAAAGVTVVSDNMLTASAPPGTGTAPITVTTPGGTSPDVAASRYTYAGVPTVTSVGPLTGSTAGGNTVTINGTNLTPAPAVTFGTTAAKVRALSSTSLLAIAPPGTGTTDVVVRTAGGTSAQTAVDRYVYAPAQTRYAYNGDDLRMTQTTAAGTSRYVWDTGPSVPQLLTDAGRSYIYGPDGVPLAQIDAAGTVNYYFHDALGSTKALLTSKGAIASTFTYSPYGTLTAKTGTATTPILFAGGYLDESTGLYYLVHRYYDTTTGGFVSMDPMVSTTGETYGYAGGDPVNAGDPLGLWWCPLLHNSNGSCRGANLHNDIHAVGTGASGAAIFLGGVAVGAGAAAVTVGTGGLDLAAIGVIGTAASYFGLAGTASDCLLSDWGQCAYGAITAGAGRFVPDGPQLLGRHGYDLVTNLAGGYIPSSVGNDSTRTSGAGASSGGGGFRCVTQSSYGSANILQPAISGRFLQGG